MKIGKNIVERPQHMWLRVAVGIHGENLDRVRETYEMMSKKWFTHATPTLFNSGTPHPQLSSCFLVAMEDDSIEGIFNTLKDCSLISKWAGGIGLHIHNIRATGSHINGTNGSSNGIVPMLRVFNNTAKYVDQCVTPNTIIYTTQGPRQICMVLDQETEIFNERGGIETISQVLEHEYEGPLLQIQTAFSSGNPLSITPEHPVYVMPSDVADMIFRTNGVCPDGLCEYQNAGDLMVGDFIAHPIPTYSKDIAQLTQEDCYFYGMLLHAGCDFTSIHTEKMPMSMQTFIVSYLSDRCIYFDAKVTVDSSVKTENVVHTFDFANSGARLSSIEWKTNTILPFRRADFYNNATERHIHSRWLNLPTEKCGLILKGILDSGAIIQREIYYECRPLVAQCIQFLALKLGILCHVFHNTIYSEVTLPPTLELCQLLGIEHDGRPSPFQRYQHFLLNPIVSIQESTYRGVLYDLQVKDTHNYLLSHGLVHNGGGKRNGSFAMYLEPWHADIEKFLQLKKNIGDEEIKARDLFYALWIPDLFMKRIKENGKWTLMNYY